MHIAPSSRTADMTIGEVVRALRLANPRERIRVTLPVEIVERVRPVHEAIEHASTRQQRRAAWRAWRSEVDRIERELIAHAKAG